MQLCGTMSLRHRAVIHCSSGRHHTLDPLLVFILPLKYSTNKCYVHIRGKLTQSFANKKGPTWLPPTSVGVLFYSLSQISCHDGTLKKGTKPGIWRGTTSLPVKKENCDIYHDNNHGKTPEYWPRNKAIGAGHTDHYSALPCWWTLSIATFLYPPALEARFTEALSVLARRKGGIIR